MSASEERESLFAFDEHGVLHLRNEYPRTYSSVEPVCPICNQPIRWCLDMSSFTTGYDHRLAHARCVWTREAFDRERELVPTDERSRRDASAGAALTSPLPGVPKRMGDPDY